MISNMMNLVKLFAPTTAPNAKTIQDNHSWPMFPLDAQIHTESLRVCKCLIPYLPFEKQKNISIFIKVFELMSVVDYFSSVDIMDNASENLRNNETWQTDLLHSVKNNLDPNNAYWVDIFFKINDVRKILAVAQSGSPATETPSLKASPTEHEPHTTTNPEASKDFIQNISPLLDDNQRKMLEMLSTIIK